MCWSMTMKVGNRRIRVVGVVLIVCVCINLSALAGRWFLCRLLVL